MMINLYRFFTLVQVKKGLCLLGLPAFFFALNSANAQFFPNLGGQRVGISAFPFLKNDLSPRSVAMSGAHTSLGSDSVFGDGYAVANNPALVSEIHKTNVTASSLIYGSGINHSFLSVAIPTGNRAAWVFSVNNLGTGPQTLRTEFQPNGNGQQFYVNSFAAGLGYSKALSSMFSFGVYGKYIREQLAEYSSATVAVDLGFLYRTDFRNLRFAAALQNFGTNSSLTGSAKPVAFYSDSKGNPVQSTIEEFSPSTLFKMGVSIDAFRQNNHLLSAAMQLNHPNDNSENIRIGLEYGYDAQFFVRTGFKINVQGQAYPSGGLGLKTRLGRHPIKIDYAAQPTQYLGLYQSIGLSVSLQSAPKMVSANEQHQ